MTNEQVLKKAIEKAVMGGYKSKYGMVVDSIIFSHSFATAFWGVQWDGADFANQTCHNKYKSPWRYHLQRMVLEKEPLKYLEKFL